MELSVCEGTGVDGEFVFLCELISTVAYFLLSALRAMTTSSRITR